MAHARDPNRAALTKVALALGSMLEEVVFVGGATVGLLITDPGAPNVRITIDVDCIVEASSRADYDSRIRKGLLQRGFVELMGEGIPLCAWVRDGVRLDVMPTDERILGFSNRWYLDAIERPDRYDLGHIQVRTIAAPYFLATKLDAFRSRGGGDFLSSPDLEDIVAVVDGRPSIVDEVEAAESVLRIHLGTEFTRLLSEKAFLHALPGHVVDRGRESVVRARLTRIANCV